MTIALFDDALDGVDEQGMIPLAGDAERDRQVGGPYHHHVESFYRKQFIGSFDGGGALVTPFGQEVIAKYRSIETRAAASAKRQLHQLEGSLRKRSG